MIRGGGSNASSRLNNKQLNVKESYRLYLRFIRADNRQVVPPSNALLDARHAFKRRSKMFARHDRTFRMEVMALVLVGALLTLIMMLDAGVL